MHRYQIQDNLFGNIRIPVTGLGIEDRFRFRKEVSKFGVTALINYLVDSKHEIQALGSWILLFILILQVSLYCQLY